MGLGFQEHEKQVLIIWESFHQTFSTLPQNRELLIDKFVNLLRSSSPLTEEDDDERFVFFFF